jgi:hypothetical protein
VPFFGMYFNLNKRYDKSFIGLLGMQYFNQGSQSLVYFA